MSKRRLFPALAVAALALCAGLASGSAQAGSPQDDPALLTLGVGGYNVLHQDKDAIFRAEYRFGAQLFWIRPIAGIEANTSGGIYAYGGFGINLAITDHIVIFPSGAFGYWSRGSFDKNLGSHDEFRTGAEIAYRFDDASRIGVTFHHISNDGITQRNPGVEEALLTYSIPLGGIFP